jgi:glycine/D-amino acid oxidase-like deaminating enzyme
MAIRSERPTDAVIIGAGIAGCTLAYELATRGLGVTVYDQGPIAAESSGRNTGTLFSGPQAEVVRLLLACAEIYDELADGPVKFGWRKIDHLLIAGDDARLDAAAGLVGRIAALGIGVQPVSGQELARDFPQLGFQVAGGFVLDTAWSLEPLMATHAFAHAAREAGARIRTGCRVAQIMARGGKVEGVLTDDGIAAADLVFAANGMWLPETLRRVVGDDPLPRIPLTAGRGWIIQTGPLDIRVPWMIEELSWPDQTDLGRSMDVGELSDIAERRDDGPGIEAVCFNPMQSGSARLGASVSPAMRDLVRNTDMPARIARRAIGLVKGFASLSIENAWLGNRPMLPDGLPVAGRTPLDGLYVLGGLGSIGMHSGPATARWLADAVAGGAGEPDLPWLTPARLPGWERPVAQRAIA